MPWLDQHGETGLMGEVSRKPPKAQGIGKGRRLNPKMPIDRGAPASVIADKFGGLIKFAQEIGRSGSTVHRWLVKGYIDNRYHDEVNAAAKRLNIKIKPTDYIDTRSKPQAAEA